MTWKAWCFRTIAYGQTPRSSTTRATLLTATTNAAVRSRSLLLHTGTVWYGGPGTTLEITAVPINLDYEGPGAPTFKPNPNKREGGWVNTAVAFTSTSSKDKNACLTKGASDAGVGGYTPQLRFAAVPSGSGKDGLPEALEATPCQAVPPGAVADSKANADCVVASAVDNLGNESARPDEGGTCEMAGNASVEAVMDDPATNDVDETVMAADAEGYFALLEADAADAEALANAGLRAGVDLTPPEAIFAGASLGKDAKALGAGPTQYILH